MIRVLLVGKGDPERGGIPTFIDLILSSSLADEHDLSFLNLAGGRRGGRWSGSNLVRTMADAAKVFRAARSADVVHLHTAFAPAPTIVRAAMLSAAARARGSRVLTHVHGGLVPRWMTTLARRQLVRAALGFADAVIAVSEGSAAALRPVAGDRVLLIENGVDLQRFHPRPVSPHARHRPVVLHVGVLTERKGVLDLLEASDRLAARGIDHEVRLVGGLPPDHREGRSVLAATTASPREGRVTVVGELDGAAMPDAYRAADVFCLASWWEAMPLSVLEAMACGLPVVATDVGDVARLVDDTVTGAVVPAQDRAALTDALDALLRDADRRREVGTAGRRRVEARWDAMATIQAIGRLYRDSAHSRG